MSTWSGYFQFRNFTGETIKTGTATHWTTDHDATDIDLTGLQEGMTTERKQFKTSTSSKDRWRVVFTLTNGAIYDSGEKDCGFESKDKDGTATLSVSLASDGRGEFLVAMPKSSNCHKNIGPVN
jgi:hypothetical protein